MRVALGVAILALCFQCFCFGQTPRQPLPGKPGRRAVVVGNATYSELPQLPVALKEAGLIETALKDADFDVMSVENASLPEFSESTVQAFLKKVQPGDVCFFYYSGHAVQAGADNFMLPVNFTRNSQLPIEGRAYSLVRLEEELVEKKAGFIIFVVEASRALDPFPGVTGLGLTKFDIEANQMLFASATQENRTAEEPPNDEPGWFTRAVAENIRKKPGVRLQEVFDQVVQDVAARTNDRQRPSLESNLTVDFFFHDPKLQIAQSRRDRTEYVHIPAGQFLMGCVPGDKKCDKHETPQHSVKISQDFWIARTDVDVTAYERFVAAGKSAHPKVKMPHPPVGFNPKWQWTNHPIVDVEWEEAKSYCSWADGRLPTEAEWEYAARGGQENQIYPFSSFSESRDKANFYGKSGNDNFEYTSPVGSFDANSFELYDMAGNVWQWVSDWYTTTYYAESPAQDPKGPPSGKEHVIRGGSFDSDPMEHLRISFRKAFSKAWSNIGFRCVLEDTPATHQLLQLP